MSFNDIFCIIKCEFFYSIPNKIVKFLCLNALTYVFIVYVTMT
jgi:hypothetical protein